MYCGAQAETTNASFPPLTENVECPSRASAFPPASVPPAGSVVRYRTGIKEGGRKVDTDTADGTAAGENADGQGAAKTSNVATKI